MSIPTADRFVRQADLVPHTKMQEMKITIIGTGAIGRPVALQLAAIGARSLQLIDPDVIELHNVTTQGYALAEIGQRKVEALARTLVKYDPGIAVEKIGDVYRSKYPVGEVVFCCVDAITTRAVLWRTISSRAQFWVDGRMLGDTLRILTVSEENSRQYYPTTLFEAAEAHQGRCTSRSTLYCATVAAGMMIHQFCRWLRGIPTDRDVLFNLLATEMTVN